VAFPELRGRSALAAKLAPHAQTTKKKLVRVIHQSVGPLPLRLAAQYASHLLVFSDASQKRHGGLAVVLFDSPDSEARVVTQTVPIIGSNELELQAAVFALGEAQRQFPSGDLPSFQTIRMP
jgi:hypothetical protein